MTVVGLVLTVVGAALQLAGLGIALHAVSRDRAEHTDRVGAWFRFVHGWWAKPPGRTQTVVVGDVIGITSAAGSATVTVNPAASIEEKVERLTQRVEAAETFASGLADRIGETERGIAHESAQRDREISAARADARRDLSASIAARISATFFGLMVTATGTLVSLIGDLLS